jgi:hypothetical protein
VHCRRKGRIICKGMETDVLTTHSISAEHVVQYCTCAVLSRNEVNRLFLYLFTAKHHLRSEIGTEYKKNPWPESATELYRPPIVCEVSTNFYE